MFVYLILHKWSNSNSDGAQIKGAFFQYQKAVDRMKTLAHADREQQVKDYGYTWNPDMCEDGKEYISYGFYGNGVFDGVCEQWELVTEEVEE